MVWVERCSDGKCCTVWVAEVLVDIKSYRAGLGYGFECGHHVGWFRVERGGAACTLVLVYVSIRLRDSQ